MTDQLCMAFRQHVPFALDDVSETELATALSERIGAGRAIWPTLSIADYDFVVFLAERTTAAGIPGLPPVAQAADLMLACACVAGHADALSHFHSTYEPVITRVLQRRAAGHNASADVKQEVFAKLLVAEPGMRPRLADYRGVGPLKSWVATVTVTTLLMVLRSDNRRREQPGDDEDPIVDPILKADPELHYLKSQYRQPVATAIVSALAQLGDRERVLLRLHLCQRLSIDRLGVMYNVNRATAARWLVSARSALLEGTRREIQVHLGVSDGESDSILNLVQSQLDVSLARYLSD